MFVNDLFSDVHHPDTRGSTGRVPDLEYIRDFITSDEASRLISFIDAEAWSDELKRRVQHYGYRYDYRVRSVDDAMRLGPLPEWAEKLGNRLMNKDLFCSAPDQVIVNEYLPGQGIAMHVDCVPCFGDTIASLSLLSSCIMLFEHKATGDRIEVDLEPGSIVLLKDDARYAWKHGIAARMQDVVGGVSRRRQRRVSATFRTVIPALERDGKHARSPT